MKNQLNSFVFLPKKTFEHLELKKRSKSKTYHTFFSVKGTSPSVTSVVLYYEQLYRDPTTANNEVFF